MVRYIIQYMVQKLFGLYVKKKKKFLVTFTVSNYSSLFFGLTHFMMKREPCVWQMLNFVYNIDF